MIRISREAAALWPLLAAVTFAAPASGASGTFAGGLNTATTNASGMATSAAFTANALTGSYAVLASVTGVSPAATFLLTNTAGSACTATKFRHSWK